MKKIFFTIHETVWWFVAELEDWLYPYKDREVIKPLWAEGYDEIQVDEASYIKSQLQGNAERIERLQSEMIHVMKELSKLKEDGKK
tara:strand:- start:871 stop:1128 length:258 start_codon:yes stop_codon:yes gene_type:complete